jgi:hypothetical protein
LSLAARRETLSRALRLTRRLCVPPTRNNIWPVDRAPTHSSETDLLYRKIYCAVIQMNSSKCDLQAHFNNPVRHHKEDPGSILTGELWRSLKESFECLNSFCIVTYVMMEIKR